MIRHILLGKDLEHFGQPVKIDPDVMRTHFHLVGATGAGKTTAIHALLRPLMSEPREKCACLLYTSPSPRDTA